MATPSIRISVALPFTPVPDLEKKDAEVLSSFVYDMVICECEKGGILLSSYGNHAGKRSEKTIEEYHEARRTKTLFNVEKIREVFTKIIGGSKEDYSSKELCVVKRELERTGVVDLTNGDCVIAFLLAGYGADFGEVDAPEVDCTIE